jgi:hypothetical protein
MDVAIGLIVGYLVGTKAGRLDFNEMRQAWDKIKRSEEAQDFVAGTADIGLQLFKQGFHMFMRPLLPQRKR